MNGWYEAGKFIQNLANYFTTEKEKQLLVKFIADDGEKFGTAKFTLTQAVEVVDSNLAWTEKRLGSLFKYLAQRNSAASAAISLVLVSFLAILNFMF